MDVVEAATEADVIGVVLVTNPELPDIETEDPLADDPDAEREG